MQQEDLDEIMYKHMPQWQKDQIFHAQKECCLSCREFECSFCEMKTFNGSRPNGYDWRHNAKH